MSTPPPPPGCGSAPPPPPPPGWQVPPQADFRCGRCGYPTSSHLCPGTRPQVPAGLVAVLTVAAIVVVLFVIWRFYIDIHCTTVLGTQVCER
jgi:hypothetical protein